MLPPRLACFSPAPKLAALPIPRCLAPDYSQEAPKQWPQLRLSSVSTRRLSPSLVSPTSSEGWGAQPSPPPQQPRPTPVIAQRAQQQHLLARQPLLSPRGSGGGFASPFTPALQAAHTPKAAGAQHYATAPFHTPILDHHADTDQLLGGPQGASAAEEAAGAGPGAGTGGGRPSQPSGVARGKRAGPAQAAGRYTRAAVAGAVNAVVALPVMLSFAAIIFRVSKNHSIVCADGVVCPCGG